MILSSTIKFGNVFSYENHTAIYLEMESFDALRILSDFYKIPVEETVYSMQVKHGEITFLIYKPMPVGTKEDQIFHIIRSDRYSVNSENEKISDYRQAVSKEEIAEIVRELGLKETDMAAKEMAEEVLNYTNLETEIKLIYKP
jgi:hypothetical protein